ncbi:methyltransferase domain-containing protein [Tunturibacter empetritectus]|uniref:SAM-dependent methyltransferase n=1 Tax=Tunturiibacter lichenicola TaxID=2051959 RepID=A0A7W8N498_9BACT|nr:methyltransferase domain-containing protein [Edaphobacter lichenicola]MBB5344283.1 SAM-dependent methyltransferase [Edaphobacter lichenicola]
MSFKQALKNNLPAPLFHFLRDVPSKAKGLFETKPSGQGPIPPLHLMFDGPRSYEHFINMGNETLEFYKTAVGVKPADSILDIGCGIGRKTIPLLDYLNPEALYVGLDIDRRGIDWLLRNVTSENRRFVFLHLDIYNKFYNPKGALLSSRLVLPFPDASFDIVALWSVFTHMFPRDIAHYLSEISRVLKPGGRVVASYYLLNDEILALMQDSKTDVNFAYQLENCRTTNPNMPEDALAVNDAWLRRVYEDLRLQPEQFLYGGWSKHTPYPGTDTINLQDIVIAQKK